MGFTTIPNPPQTDNQDMDKYLSSLRRDLMTGDFKLSQSYKYPVLFTQMQVTKITFNGVSLIPTVTGGGAAALPAFPTAYIPMEFLIAGQLFTLYVPGYAL